MNTQLLLQVKNLIETEPAKLNMEVYLEGEDDSHMNLMIAGDLAEKNECGTVGCIAGWASALGPKSKETLVFRVGASTGRKALDITHDQAERLFFVNLWPAKFAVDYWRGEDKQAKSKVTAARIDHFIATEGRE